MTEFLRQEVPSSTEKSRADWEDRVTERTNEHAGRLVELGRKVEPRIETFEGVPAELMNALAKDCPDGLGSKFYHVEDLLLLLPNVSEGQIEVAVFDLADHGMFDVQSFINAGWRLRLEEKFYHQLDHQIMGWNTIDDATTLAELMCEEDSLSDIKALHDHVRWPLRRLNPAVTYLKRFIPEGRTRDPIQATYSVIGFLLMPEDKVKLRRFIKESRAI